MDNSSSTSCAITDFIVSLIANIDGHTRPQIVPNVLLKVSVREIYYRLVSAPYDSGIKEEIYAYNNIIISDSTLRSLLPALIKQIHHYTRSCMVVNVLYPPKYTFLVTIMA